MNEKIYPCDLDACGECPFGYQHCADCHPINVPLYEEDEKEEEEA